MAEMKTKQGRGYKGATSQPDAGLRGDLERHWNFSNLYGNAFKSGKLRLQTSRIDQVIKG